jgi:hypothetical protein
MKALPCFSLLGQLRHALVAELSHNDLHVRQSLKDYSDADCLGHLSLCFIERFPNMERPCV